MILIRTLVHTFVLMTLATVIASCSSSSRETARLGVATDTATGIVGGVGAQTTEFPFIVSLQKNGNLFCGGALISPEWVLTAAHCMGIKDFQVVVGAYKLSAKDGERFDVAEVRVHPQYDGHGQIWDYAMVRLKGKSAAPVVPISTQRMEDRWGRIVLTVAGWGTTKENGQISDTLLKVQVPLINKQRCTTAYGQKLAPTTLCAGFTAGGFDSCQGDSGGPLMRVVNGQYVQVGIVSWGNGCAEPKYYGIYSDVAYGSEWIQAQLKSVTTP